MGHADALSRCPLPDLVSDPAPLLPVMAIHHLDSSPITASRIAAMSKTDPILKDVMGWVLRGWPPGNVGSQLLAYGLKREELSVIHGVLLWGDRVVIPLKLQQEVLELLHLGHPGVVRMKALARSYVWWPGLDNCVESFVASCSPCQAHRNNPPKIPPAKWEQATGPWNRVHIDFAGPFQGAMLFVLVDAYSKWVEVVKMASTTTEAVIPVLRSIFATHGLPDVLVSDNGPQFTSLPMEEFLADLGIKHVLTAPYHPQANGLAEKYVHVTKLALQRLTKGSWQDRISTYLMWQHATPTTATGVSPAELLMGRRLRTIIDRMHPKFCPCTDPVTNGVPEKSLSPDRNVHARSYRDGETWVPARVLRNTGPRSYEVQLEDGRVWKRHADQLRQASAMVQGASSPPDEKFLISAPDSSPRPVARAVSRSEPVQTRSHTDGHEGASVSPPPIAPPTSEPLILPPTPPAPTPPDTTGLRRSSRLRSRPGHLKDFILNGMCISYC